MALCRCNLVESNLLLGLLGTKQRRLVIVAQIMDYVGHVSRWIQQTAQRCHGNAAIDRIIDGNYCCMHYNSITHNIISSSSSSAFLSFSQLSIHLRYTH